MGRGDFILDDPMAGLADLSSYRATLITSFDGTRDGEPEQWTTTTSLISSQNPRAFLYTVDQPAKLGPPLFGWAAERDGAAYQLDATGACSAILANDDEQGAPEPASALSGLFGAEAAGQETVVGIAADVFAFDGSALGFPAETRATGRIWIATVGGQVLKYEMTSEAGQAYFGEGISGSMSIDYQLTDINGAVSIDLPADCPPGLIEAPMTADAVTTESLPGFLRYTTNVSVADAAALYRDTSVAFGWTSNRTAAIGQEFAALSFDHDLLLIDVLVTDADAGTEVTIVSNWK